MLAYIISANTIAAAIQRDVQVNEISSASQQLVARIGVEEQKATSTLAQHTAALAQLAAEEEQSRTEQAIIKVQTQTLLQADITAHAHVSQAQKALAAAVAALAAARARDAIYQPIPGPLFTVDTNLTLPSGETAASLNQFLNGSALAGLGASFMQAESTYHVSARYFVAHAILESGWGTSCDRADYKHNLFGFGADDANPYGDAMTFTSFDACIQYVAQFIEVNYLTRRRPVLSRSDAARDERRLRERPQLGREDRQHRRHDSSTSRSLTADRRQPDHGGVPLHLCDKKVTSGGRKVEK